MNLEFHIARRMAHATDGRSRSVMERIAIFAVALSVAVMVVSLAVIVGFKEQISQKMSAFSAHVVVTDVGGVQRLNAEPFTESEALRRLVASHEGFVRMQRYAERGGIVRTSEAVEGVLLKGVGVDYDWQPVREWLVEGALPRVGDSIRTKDVLISRSLSDRLQLGVGDRIELLFVETDEAPHRDRFKISGLYSSGMEEMDNRVVFTDIRNVQRLSLWNTDQISGYEIFLSSLDRAEAFAEELDHNLLYSDEELPAVTAVAVQRLYPNIFDWLKAHDVNAAVILVIMLVVAFFNMSAALLILVFERIRMIGVLKALGMQHRSLRRIFLYRALYIALRGLVWGNVAGLTLCVVQALFEVVKLDSEGYLLSSVPIGLEWGWWLLLNVGFVASIVVLMLLPASVVATVKPDETMRYE